MSRVRRPVTAVMSDNMHCIHLVELQTRVLYRQGVERTHAQVDLEQVTEQAKERAAKLGKDDYDVVGILVAIDVRGEQGRIVWAEDDRVAAAERRAAEVKLELPQ